MDLISDNYLRICFQNSLALPPINFEATIQRPLLAVHESSYSSAIDPWTAVGVVVTVLAQALYIRQIRRGHAAKNFTSMALNTANDSLLFGAAVATGQGSAAIGVMGAYSLMDIIATHQIYKKDRSMNLKKSDAVCLAGCLVGWCALFNFLPEIGQKSLTESQQNFAASIIASSVNLLAMMPLLRDAIFAPIAPSDLVQRPQTLKAIVICGLMPAAPWLLDLIAYSAAVVVAPKASIEQWLQPVAILAIGLLAAAASVVWGGRRIIKVPATGS